MVKLQSRLHLWLALLYFLNLDFFEQNFVGCERGIDDPSADMTHDLVNVRVDENFKQVRVASYPTKSDPANLMDNDKWTTGTKDSQNVGKDLKNGERKTNFIPEENLSQIFGNDASIKFLEQLQDDEALSDNWKELRNLKVTNIEDLSNGTRDDEKSLTHSCDKIRKVPIIMRLSFEIDFKYRKYTEAYGIPIVSSYDVDDRALKRACYLIRFMLADLKEARDNFYDRRGWVNVLGMNEIPNRLAKYCPLPHWKDGKHYSRAISPTWTFPVTTLPEENLLCIKKNDAMRNEDFGIHALAHAIHVIALRFVDPEFNIKLTILHEQARQKGIWNNTYAIRDALEYWAEGVQSYFNVNVERSYIDTVHNGINTREELRQYDKDLHDLIESIFPCRNVLINRCHDFWQERSMKQILKVNYPACGLETEAHEHRRSSQEKPKTSTVKDVIYICTYGATSVVLYVVTRVLINKNKTEST